MKRQEIKERLTNLGYDIADIIKDSGYKSWDEIRIEDDEELNPDIRFELLQMNRIMEDLLDVKNKLEYLAGEIVYEGRLQKNKYDKFCCDEFVFSCGDRIEILLYDEESEDSKWVLTRIEHNGESYYAKGYAQMDLEGVMARVRWSKRFDEFSWF